MKPQPTPIDQWIKENTTARSFDRGEKHCLLQIPDSRKVRDLLIAQNMGEVPIRVTGHTLETESECRSCGAPIPSNRTKCLFCLSEHIEPTDEETTASAGNLLSVVFIAVTAQTKYEAIAKGAAACQKLVSDTGPIDGYQLIDDIDDPAPQLVKRWSSLPTATTLTSETGQQLLERLVTVVDEDFSRWSAADGEFPILYNEWGQVVNDSDQAIGLEGDHQWFVSALALHEDPKSNHTTQTEPDIPTKTRLFCRACESETIHVVDGRDTASDTAVPATPVWQCNRCQSPQHGPDPK
ncbi:hypothetical protein [Natrinema sp. 74]|uniref:hypothetical protein n=1 Tax=Natrinema sp. 74 TaxID=3384159 RepID=UPI0038D5076F